MNLSDSKKKLALAGGLCGLVAAALAYFGNPANMAFCIACFIRDTAGALGMHQAAPVMYARPEIIGLVLGAFIISVATKEYRSTAGSAPMIRFILGMIIMIGSLVFFGMSAAYGNPYVGRGLECMGSVDWICTWCCNWRSGVEERFQPWKSICNKRSIRRSSSDYYSGDFDSSDSYELVEV